MTYAEQVAAAVADKRSSNGARRRRLPALRRLDEAEARRTLSAFIRFGPPEVGHEGSDPLDEQFDDERVSSHRRWLVMERIAPEDRVLTGGIPTEWPEEERFDGEETMMYEESCVSLED